LFVSLAVYGENWFSRDRSGEKLPGFKDFRMELICAKAGSNGGKPSGDVSESKSAGTRVRTSPRLGWVILVLVASWGMPPALLEW
jgi:hypothetical protein